MTDEESDADWREDLGRQGYRPTDESRFLAERTADVLRLLGQEHLQHRLRDWKVRNSLWTCRLRQVLAHNNIIR